MARENEVKIVLKIDLNKFIKRIQTKNFQLLHTLNQMDTYFDTKDWLLYNNLSALRLRQIGGKDHSFCFKKVFYLPQKRNKYYVEEIETKFPLNDKNGLHEIFGRIDVPTENCSFEDGAMLSKHMVKNRFLDSQKMTKVRKVYANNVDKITIDNVSGVGTIVELECEKNKPLEIIDELLATSEWERGIEGVGYAWLRINKGFTAHLDNVKRFETEPDWNVLENEKEMYLRIQK